MPECYYVNICTISYGYNYAVANCVIVLLIQWNQHNLRDQDEAIIEVS